MFFSFTLPSRLLSLSRYSLDIPWSTTINVISRFLSYWLSQESMKGKIHPTWTIQCILKVTKLWRKKIPPIHLISSSTHVVSVRYYHENTKPNITYSYSPSWKKSVLSFGLCRCGGLRMVCVLLPQSLPQQGDQLWTFQTVKDSSYCLYGWGSVHILSMCTQMYVCVNGITLPLSSKEYLTLWWSFKIVN